MQLTALPTALLAFLPLTQAAYGYGSSYGSGSGSSSGSSGSSSGAPSSAAAAVAGVHIVKVGQNGQTFDPAELVVPAGQVIEFHYYPQAHSVAQSAFQTPCTPLQTANATGFFSGPVPVSSGESTTVFTVTSTGAAMWFYCATGQHCQNGMVGVINAPANNANRTLALYKTAARAAQRNVAPDAVRGGTLGQAATTSPASPSDTFTPGGAGGNSTRPNAGMPAVGLNLNILAVAVTAAGVLGGFFL